MRRRALVVVLGLASCSSRDREPSPSPTSSPTPAPASPAEPPLTEAQKQDIGRQVIEQARADANTSPCNLPAALDGGEVAGKLVISTFGGKLTHTATGELDGRSIGIYAGAKVPTGTTTLRKRRGIDDLARPIVVELYAEGHALDAIAGTLVIDKATPELVGHLDNAEFRERREDYAYVDNGCTARISRIDFRFRK